MTARKPASRQGGMTLIELMVVIVVLGVIVSIAMPSYRTFVVRSNRSEATTSMMSIAQELERCFTRFSAYNNAGCDMANTLTGAGFVTETNKYTITGVVAATTFALTAAPSFSDDAECGSFTLNNAAQRGITGTGSSRGLCW